MSGVVGSRVTLRPIRYQVSGHTPILHNVECPSHSYKPFSAAEHAFYTRLYSDSSLEKLRALAPKFFGVASVDTVDVGVDANQHVLHFSKQCPENTSALEAKMVLAEDGRAEFLVLECIGCGIEHPCIADFKLGLAEEANAKMKALDKSMASFSAEKLRWKAEKAQRTTSAALGCRMCGMLVWNPVDKKHVFRDKYSAFDCFEDSRASLRNSARAFFADGAGGLRLPVLKECLARVQEIRRVISSIEMCPFLLWSTSLFIAYDGEYQEPSAAADSGSDVSDHVHVKLLDFGRVVPLDTDELRALFGQDGVAEGLANMEEALSSLLYTQ